ncbi:MAG: peroxiredoxin family protein [Gammaproteobacteria bacterium]|nr:peroxiredoxin family protein [Gammaproteobacteria bacterium]
MQINLIWIIGIATALLVILGWQVRELTRHYKEIVDLGARLIFVTPNPLETTRRVAEFFEVEFDFWLDTDSAIAKQLGLDMPAGVPGEHRKEYGADTVWPTALIVDATGIIRYSKLSRYIIDRPNPGALLDELRKFLLPLRAQACSEIKT